MAQIQDHESCLDSVGQVEWAWGWRIQFGKNREKGRQQDRLISGGQIYGDTMRRMMVRG